jgi:hypothetical protein
VSQIVLPEILRASTHVKVCVTLWLIFIPTIKYALLRKVLGGKVLKKIIFLVGLLIYDSNISSFIIREPVI